MTDVILRYLDYDVMKTQLGELGITVKVAEDGQTLKVEGRFGLVNTPTLHTRAGEVFLIRMSDDDAARLDDYIAPPNFICDWRSDEGYENIDGETVQYDRPIYDVGATDMDGNPTIVQRGCGKIMEYHGN